MTNLSQCLANIRHVFTQAERTMADVVREMEHQPPKVNWGIVFILYWVLFFIFVIALSNCSTIQRTEDSKLEPVIRNKISEIESSETMTKQEKKSTIAVIEAQRDENKSLRGLLKERDFMIQNQADKLESCQAELKNTSENAGKYLGYRNLFIASLIAVGVYILLRVLNAVGFKIPIPL